MMIKFLRKGAEVRVYIGKWNHFLNHINDYGFGLKSRILQFGFFRIEDYSLGK